MDVVIKRLRNSLTIGELEVVNELKKIEEDELIINSSELAQSAGAARSMANTTLRILGIVGIIECTSMGAKGTYLRILNREALEFIAKR